jgi:anti-sigma28 factor (negative regulator of flagellin synthesis)
MKIGENEELRAFNRADYAAQGKNMSAKKKDNKRIDELKISLKIPKNAARDAEIRKEKVNLARENIAAGRYKDSEIVNVIVDRLMAQLGI